MNAKHLTAMPLALVLSLLCASCGTPQDSPLLLEVEDRNGLLALDLKNNGKGDITFSVEPTSLLKSPASDVFYVFSVEGSLIGQCVGVDQLESGRITIPTGGSFRFNEEVGQLSEVFCLDDQRRYELKIAYAEFEDGGYRIISESNTVPFVARTQRKLRPNYPLTLNREGSRFETSQQADVE